MINNRRIWNIKEYLAIGAILAWLLLIFLLSNQVADNSSAMSGGISAWVLGLINNLSQSINLDHNALHFYIRKTAHFTEYLILGILIYNGFYQFNHWVSNKVLCLSWLVCIGYAITDEVHQYFIPGRSMEARDVAIDSIGALAGLLLLALIRRGKNSPPRQRNKK